MEDLTEEQLRKSGLELAALGRHFENENQLEAALFYYKESAALLISAFEKDSTSKEIEVQIEHCLNRSKTIECNLQKEKSQIEPKRLPENNVSDLRRAEFLLRNAFVEDELGNTELAVELYSQAVELCLKAKHEVENETTKRKLNKLAEEALSRAERLKGIDATCVVNKATAKLKIDASQTSKCESENSSKYESGNSSKLIVIGASSYNEHEIRVLKTTSRINGRKYVPFLSVDVNEKFAYSLPFSDSDGLLKLSSKQSQHFKRWVRLDELSASPKIISEIDCFSIKQTLVSDCSFIASLTVSALYEKRFKKKLVTTIIYPQNRLREPCYNPCGKYMVKIHINGIYRKVIIDDYLPVDRYNCLLCSHSVREDEFWVSLLEKAYMKIMGGYDFPGSNSSIDLNALTGWIPERISTSDSSFNCDKVFQLLFERFHRGEVLITVATGDMSDDTAERTGLVPNHAYALLDIRSIDAQRLFLLKNPWRHLRWKGNFSEYDVSNWTSKLKAALNYDPQNARNFDNGVFWIDLKSFCKFFDTIYLSWNPSLFKYTFCTHSTWSSTVGPVKDVYNMANNPQYLLNVERGNCTLFILLTRHITDKVDFAENQIYIAVIVYKGGEKIYLPFDPPPFIDGSRINSPHYLCKLVVPENGDLKYTLVISQYEKTSTIHYTLRVYSTVSFSLAKLEDPYKFRENITDGRWTEKTAGGCLNNRSTYSMNPMYQLEVLGARDVDNHLLIELKGPKQYNIGFDIMTVTLSDTNSAFKFDRMSSGAYRSGFTILKVNRVPSGTYNIIPSTFNFGEKGPFFLTVNSTCPIKIKQIR